MFAPVDRRLCPRYPGSGVFLSEHFIKLDDDVRLAKGKTWPALSPSDSVPVLLRRFVSRWLVVGIHRYGMYSVPVYLDTNK